MTGTNPRRNHAALRNLARIAPFERDLLGLVLILAVAVICAEAFPDMLSFLSGMIALMLLVIALDLVTGVCGVATLGHAALFGAGAYAAGIAGANGIADPLLLLVIGLGAGAVAGLVTGALILRTHGLPQLVMSIALVQLAREGVNKAGVVTGGSDGLTGIRVDPLFGVFAFDLWGVTAYWLSVAVLLVVVFLTRRLVRSPFGLLCRGVRQDPARVRLMGQPVYAAALRMYVISGGVAGLGGALTAIATQVVGLDSIGFTLSAEALVMLIVGGTGTIFGAVAGTFVFMWFEHTVSAANPFHWLMIVGAVLIAVVLFAPRGIAGSVSQVARRVMKERIR